MERADLARRLGASSGPATPGPIVISEADPRTFMAAFAAAVTTDENIFLCDPRWSDLERKQVAELTAVSVSTVGQAKAEGSPLRRRPGEGGRSPVSEQGWLMIPTGGTSGRIKFARHDGHTVAAAVRGFTERFGLERVNAVGLLPLHHVSGLMAWLRCALTGGDYLPLEWKAVEAGELPALSGNSDGWVISLVPTQLERLINPRGGPASRPAAVGREAGPPNGAIEWLQRFRIIFLGGAPAWPALLERAAALRLPISTGYGMTETAAMITALRPQEFLAGVRSNGMPLPHGAVTIGEVDRVILRGTSLFRGYYPDWREPGDFATQDRGRLDAQGQLHILGRIDTVIITGGEKVEPAEVEAVLRDSGEFSEVVVLGLADAEWGQAIAAVYPATTRPNMVRVNAALAALSPVKRPKHFLPIADWPVNAQGKVNRVQLRTQLENLRPET